VELSIIDGTHCEGLLAYEVKASDQPDFTLNFRGPIFDFASDDGS
jgi:hypothetical protein